MIYAFGYQIDKETGAPVQAGGLVIKTPVKNVTVYKDGKAIKTNDFISDLITDFIKIENLSPGSYDIEVVKEGYQNWQKNIEIKSGQVEKFESIMILKNKYEENRILEEIDLTKYSQTWISKDKKQIAYLNEEDGQKNIYIAYLEDEKTEKIITDKQISLMGDIQKIYWIEDSNLLAIESIYNQKANLQIFSLDSKKIYTLNEDLSEIILKQQNREKLNISGDFIVFTQDSVLYSFNYITKETRKIFDGVGNFDVQGKNIYFFKSSEVNSEQFIYKIEIESATGREIKFAKKPNEYSSSDPFEAQEQNNRLLILSADSLYFIDKDGTSEKIGFDIKNAFFFQNSRRIALYGGNEIWIYYTENKTYQPTKQKGEKELITRFSGKLEDIYMYQDEEHIFYRENNQIKFAEMDNRDKRNVQTISEETDNFSSIYSRNKNTIYIIKEGRILKISLSAE